MIKIEDLVFEGCNCTGYQADHFFENGLTARIVKIEDTYTLLCLKDGVLVTKPFGIERNIDAQKVTQLLQTMALS